MRRLVPTLVIAAALVTPAAAQDPTMYRGITGQALVEIVREAGFTAKLGRDSYDDPQITSQAQGVEFSIMFYDCDNTVDETCGSIAFLAHLDPDDPQTAERMNSWNSQARYAYAYLEDDQTVLLTYGVDLSGGVTTEVLTSALAEWDVRYGEFLNHVNWPR